MSRSAALLVVLAQLAGCWGRIDQHQEFFARQILDQHERFRALPPDQQVDIYLAAMRRHPPDLAFASDIAETHGRDALPALRAALRAEKDEALRCDLLYVLERMVAPNAVALDEETVQVASEAVGDMRFDVFRSRAEKQLATIRSGLEKPTP